MVQGMVLLALLGSGQARSGCDRLGVLFHRDAMDQLTNCL
jgi:hypothetical protein